MTLTADQVAALSANLDRKHVKSRAQAGRQLSYIEGWHAIAEANRIFGYDAWDRETVELHQLGDPRKGTNQRGDEQWRVGYMARVRVTVRAGDVVVTRDGCGFGSGIDKDVDQAHESALKEAETDAMKRALMTFGNPFGLALYDKTQAAVADTPKPARATSDPQTPEEIQEAADWAAEALALKQMIANTTTRDYLNNLVKTARFEEFKDRAPDSLVQQVRDAVKAKSETYRATAV